MLEAAARPSDEDAGRSQLPKKPRASRLPDENRVNRTSEYADLAGAHLGRVLYQTTTWLGRLLDMSSR